MSERGTQQLELDTALGLLTDERRRRLLVGLAEADGRRSVDALAPDDDRSRLEMNHKHLPMLEDAAVVEWDRDCYEVSPGPLFDDLAPLLELLDGNAEVLPGEWT